MPRLSVSRQAQGIVLLTGLFVFAGSGMSRACLNDTSVERAEQEFRSRYNSPAPKPAVNNGGLNPLGLATLCVGGGIASGCLIVAVGRKRRGDL